MKFKPGERARIIRTGPKHALVNGKECIVVKSTDNWISQMKGEQCYFVDVPGYVPTIGTHLLARESILAKLLPPGWEKTTWDQCPWRPKHLEKVSA